MSVNLPNLKLSKSRQASAESDHEADAVDMPLAKADANQEMLNELNNIQSGNTEPARSTSGPEEKQNLDPAPPPQTTSKEAYDPPDEETDAQNLVKNAAYPVIRFEDVAVNDAALMETGLIVRLIHKMLSDVKDPTDKVLLAKKKSEMDDLRSLMISRIITRVKGTEKKTWSTQRKEEVYKIIVSGDDALFRECFDSAVQLRKKELVRITRPKAVGERERREAVTSTLKKLQSEASYYEIFEIEPNATASDIRKAYHKMAMYVHSDKIKDPDSDRCMQAINQAKETLLDERKRKEYDRTLKTNGKKQVPEPDIGEEFHDNAYGQEEDSSDDDEAIVFDDNDVPERPPEVAAYHERFDESVIRILQNVQSKDSMGKDFGKVAKMNRKINKVNKHNKVFEDYYTVSIGVLQMTRHEAEALLNDVSNANEADEKISKLKSDFAKRCSQRMNQWPVSWAEKLVEPLRAKIADLRQQQGGKSDQYRQSGEKEIRNGSDKGKKTGGRHDTVHEDQEMEDFYDQFSSDIDMDASIDLDNDSDLESSNGIEANEQVQPTRPKPIVPSKAGYTLFGDRILGYSIKERYDRLSEKKVPFASQFVVKVDKPNPIQLVSGSELGYEAIALYHSLPEEDKNNISHQERIYKYVKANEFDGIRGVAYVNEPGSFLTYVWVERKGMTNTEKPIIMSRTALRAWIGPKFADKVIDNFLVQKCVKPPWAPQLGQLTYPSYNNEYLEIQFPRAIQDSASHRLRSGCIGSTSNEETGILGKLFMLSLEEKKERERERHERKRDRIENRELLRMLMSK